MNKIDIAQIKWDQAKYLGSGAWGMVFDLGGEIVAKVGVTVRTDEAAAQQYVYERHNKALPVLGHQEKLWLPESIRQACCPEHGLGNREKRQSYISSFLGKSCTCEENLGVMCMPKADPDAAGHQDAKEIRDFMNDIWNICYNEFRRPWDDHEGNMAWWDGHLVALDFSANSHVLYNVYGVSWELREEHREILALAA